MSAISKLLQRWQRFQASPPPFLVSENKEPRKGRTKKGAHDGSIIEFEDRQFGFLILVKYLTGSPASLGADLAVWLASPEAALLKAKIVWASWDVNELISRVEVPDSGDQ